MVNQLQLNPRKGRDRYAVTPAEVARVFDAARLTQARWLAGLTKTALADAIGVTSVVVGQWEAYAASPDGDHLQRLAEILDVPVGFFTAGRPHARMDASTAHFRNMRPTCITQRAKAVAFVEQTWELVHTLERHIQFPSIGLPDIDTDIEFPTDPVGAARALRTHWGLGRTPIPHLVRTMENQGIIVMMASFAGDDTAQVDAFSTSYLPRPLVMLTPDRTDDVCRYRFTAAHELGHLVLHRNSAPGDPQQEHEADLFAAEFLAPAAVMESLLPSRVSLQKLDELSHTWGVSVKSLLYRSQELGLISAASARRACQRLDQLTAAGFFAPQKIDAYPGEIPVLLSKAFDLIRDHDLFTLPSLARELRWKISRLRLLLGQVDEYPDLQVVQ